MRYLLLTAGCFALDTVLKILAHRIPPKGASDRAFLNFTRVENPYFAGGHGKKLKKIIRPLTVLVLLIFCAEAAVLFLSKELSVPCFVGLSLLAAGGLNNGGERVFRGKVTDYLRFPRALPHRLRRLVFNLSDFYLFFGALAVVIGALAECF